MPRGDGTGPAGLGPMTGRAAGRCAGYPTPGYLNNFWPGAGYRFRGRGWGRGWGRGRGRWNWGLPYPAAPGTTPLSTEQEAQALRAQAELLEESLNGIRRRIAELQPVPGEAG